MSDVGAGGPVLITGGAGFIGSNLANRLARAGHHVRVLDNLRRVGVEDNLRWLRREHGARIEVRVADVRDGAALRLALSDAQAVFHLAAQVAVTTSLQSPLSDLDVNLLGTVRLLEAIRHSPRRPPLLFASTNKVYGCLPDVELREEGGRWLPRDAHVRDHGIDESRPLEFRSPYGCSKGGADQYVLDYAQTFGLPAVVFRLSCVYGPRQFGTEDQGWVAHVVRRAMTSQRVTVFGDGQQVRDILFVEDLTAAMHLAWQHMDEIRGRAFNVGGGPSNAVSLAEIVRRAGELTGRPIHLDYADWRPGDQRYYVSDTRAFAKSTGWEVHTGVATGLGALHEWLSSCSAATQVSVSAGAASSRTVDV